MDRGTVLALAAAFLVLLACSADAAPSRETGPGWIGATAGPAAGGQIHLTFLLQGPAAVGIEIRSSEITHGPMWYWGGRATEVGISTVGDDVGTTIDPWNEPKTVTYPVFAGTEQILVWTAGDVGWWFWSVDGVEGVEEVARGDSHFWDGSEGAEGIHAHASVDGRGSSWSKARYGFEVEGELRGIAGWLPQRTAIAPVVPPQDVSEDEIRLHLPDGAIEICPCTPRGGWAAGHYELVWEGYTVHSGGQQPILLAGVDAPAWFISRSER